MVVVAQLVELQIVDLAVTGSIPVDHPSGSIPDDRPIGGAIIAQ